MKEIQIIVRLDESGIQGQMGQIVKHKGFENDSEISLILTTIGVLDNMKQNFLDKLSNKNFTMKQ